ncbi:YbhB/YbcL family Raf kinase inhibitor-like protein [Kitasatospora sp. NBC_01250]|uniref:YbhB/YbcL family Raf kinase inhibitor-like protein n=1 Tax=Kitasatospora sp. NBC_01250 TaxID=2903571 RepID=UPI003FA52DFC
MLDPDAPTGAGFWHWVTRDNPAAATGLGSTPPPGTVSGTNSAGATGYLGPCPGSGDITHHYRISVYALDTPTLGLPATTPAGVTTFTMSGHILGYARITADARR